MSASIALKDIGDLVGDGLERRAGQMGGGGGVGHAGDGAARGVVPVRRAKAGEGGDEGDATACRARSGQGAESGGILAGPEAAP